LRTPSIETSGLCDAHVHFGKCGLTGLTFYEKDVENLIKRFGIDKMLLFPFDIDTYDSNKRIIKMTRTWRQITPLIRISLNDLRSYRMLAKYLKADAVGGVKIHPSMDGIPVTNDYYASAFELVDRYNKIALIHCGRWEQVSSYKFALEIARKHPKARIIIAHMGGNELANTKGAIEGAKDVGNVYLDTSNCRIPLMVKYAVQQIGSNRLVFGSDTPWGSILPNLFTVLDADIPLKEKNRIFTNLGKII